MKLHNIRCSQVLSKIVILRNNTYYSFESIVKATLLKYHLFFSVTFVYRDPNLWMVKCRQGEEKNTALLLMRKYISYLNSESPLQIKSVVAPEGVKGYVYIEAFKQAHLKQAIENVGFLRLGIWKQQVNVYMHSLHCILNYENN